MTHRKLMRVAGVAQRDDAQHHQQQAEGQIVLKGQPEQVAGEVPHQLDRAEQDHARCPAAARSTGRRRPA